MTCSYLVKDFGDFPITDVAQQEILGHQLRYCRVLPALLLGARVARVALCQPPQVSQQPISVHAPPFRRCSLRDRSIAVPATRGGGSPPSALSEQVVSDELQ